VHFESKQIYLNFIKIIGYNQNGND